MLSSHRSNTPRENTGEIVKQGSLRKLKTMKKKYFVLRGDSPDSSACLEYYENEKKFRTNGPPKRVIQLKMCFNINRLSDKKQKFVIGLYSRVGCFCIVFDTEQELDEWLEALLRLQHGENLPVGEPVKPFFEHVWKVEVMDRDMGSKMGILGSYHVCLTNQVISLIKASSDDSYSTINFCLEKLRACGHMNTFFYMQVGNDTVTGAGNLWMTTGDATIAESMHTTIMKACARCHKDPQPKPRNRSSSANEYSKQPVHTIQRWPTHTGEYVTSPRYVASLRPSERRHSVAGLTQVRDKYDSMQVISRARTTSEGNHLLYNRSSRPYSIYIKTSSPPVHPSPLSPVLGACSTDSAGSSMSMDGEGDWDESSAPRFHSLTPDEPVIEEENSDEYPPWPQVEDEKLNNYMHMGSTGSVTNPSYRKISPTPYPQGIKSSSPSQGSLADVYSPVSSSPLESQSGYMPMSPVDVRVAPFSSGHSHSRGSSIDDMGYMSTLPTQHYSNTHSDDGYVDMDQKNNRERYPSCGNTSGGSSCSLTTSGTASVDLTKFSECSLDRVSSGIGQEELRPARAYSVGSRPHSTSKSEVLAGGEEKRVRAFSVGSHQQGSRMSSLGGRITGSLRSQANPAGSLPSQSMSLSHSIVEPTDDLMELDFTKRAKHNKNMRVAKKPSSAEKLSDTGLSPPKANRLVAALLFGRSPPKIPVSPPQGHPSPSLDRVPEAEPGYLEMTVQRPDTYMDMKPVVAPVKHTLKPQSFPKITSHQGSTGGSHQPPIKPALLTSKPSPECYVDMNLKRKTSLVEDNNNSKIVISQNQVQTNNGYVEMQIKSNSPLPQKQESNYMNMGGNHKPEKRHNRKDRRFSQPIKIQVKEVARKTTPLMLPISSSASANGMASSADSNRSVDSNRLEHGSDDSKNGSLESKIFNTQKSPCNACDYVMFQAPGMAGSKSDPMADYTMMGPPSHPLSRGNDTVDLLRTGLVSVSLSDSENTSRHSEDEPTTDSSKSLSRASSTASVGEKEVEYASLDLRSDDDRLAAPPPQPHSYARIDFNFESNKLKN